MIGEDYNLYIKQLQSINQSINQSLFVLILLQIDITKFNENIKSKN